VLRPLKPSEWDAFKFLKVAIVFSTNGNAVMLAALIRTVEPEYSVSEFADDLWAIHSSISKHLRAVDSCRALNSLRNVQKTNSNKVILNELAG
jgi:hypothetical protein